MEINRDIVEGIFINECKNRFLCNILIKNEIHECYIPSSSKLDNYIKLENKKVLLTVNKGKKTRTKYSVFAVKYYGKYIMLNLNIVNSLVEEYIKMNNKNYFYTKIFREKTINDYKADLLLHGKEKLIVEAKGLIAIRKQSLFPTVFSERALKQLNNLLKLLELGWRIDYYFVSLSSVVKKVIINKEFNEYSNLLLRCIDRGMKVKGFSACYENNKVIIESNLKIEI